MSDRQSTITLGDIETRAKHYAHARDLLQSRVQQLQDEYEQSKRRAMPTIKSALATLKAAESELRAALAASPDLFKRPRSVVMHGIKVGYTKGKGATVIDNPEQTIKLIRKLLPDKAEILVVVKESVAKDALSALDAGTLKKLGVRIDASGDQIVIKAVDAELDKMLAALLKSDADDEIEGACQ